MCPRAIEVNVSSQPRMEISRSSAEYNSRRTMSCWNDRQAEGWDGLLRGLVVDEAVHFP
jgi:hypothetical protein